MPELRTLFVGQLPPYPTASGGNQRSHLLLQVLRKQGPVELVLTSSYLFNEVADLEKMRSDFGPVTVVPHKDPILGSRLGRALKWAGEAGRQATSSVTDRRKLYAIDPAVEAVVQARIRAFQPDIIVGRMMLPTAWSGLLSHPTALIVDIDDLDTQALASRLDDKASGLRRLITSRHLRQLTSLYPDLLRKISHGWVTNQGDCHTVRDFGVSASVLPNIPFSRTYSKGTPPRATEPSSITSKTIMMVGDMAHTPNRVGVDHFVSQIWPLVRQKEPQANFRIIGSNMWDTSSWASVPGVEPVGYVDDLDEEYRKAALVVVPVFEGGGTKIKVLESLNHERTPVVSHHSMRGYTDHLIDGKHLAVARTDNEFVEQIVSLLREPDRRNEIATAGRAMVEREFSFQRFEQTILDDVKRVLGHRREQGLQPVETEASLPL